MIIQAFSTKLIYICFLLIGCKVSSILIEQIFGGKISLTKQSALLTEAWRNSSGTAVLCFPVEFQQLHSATRLVPPR